MKERNLPSHPTAYQIKVQGRLSENWLQNFEGLRTAFDGEATTLTGSMADQAALRGLLNWLWNLNLTLLSVTRLDTFAPQERDKDDE